MLLSPQHLTTAWTLACVGAYLLSTAPFLFLLPLAHRGQAEGRTWLLAGMVLQLLPIGLIFFPLGFVGVAILGGAWVATLRRQRLFALSGILRPDLAAAWRQEQLLAGAATTLALQQKGVALAFLEAARGHGGWPLAGALLLWGLALWAPWLLWALRWGPQGGWPFLRPSPAREGPGCP